MSSMLELPAALADPRPAGLRLVPVGAVPAGPLDFDSAVRRITPRLQRYAQRRLGDAHEAEELVQEALLRAYQHRDTLATEDDLIAWCTVVTGRLVIDRLRVRGRSVSVAEVPDRGRVGRDTADVVVARDETRMALDALEAMPSRQAAVLWAREVEGQAYGEIGVRFGMTEPAVRSILTRARKALRKEYAARGGTLPVAGLAALAPWVGGLRWIGRVRSTATRLAAPAAVGAMALGLVGGALYSPLFASPTIDPGQTYAVAVGPLGPVTALADDRPGRLAERPAAVRTTPGAGPVAVRDTDPTPTLAERAPTSTSCVRAKNRRLAGGDSCVGGGRGSRLWVNKPLPDNPTGVRYVGVEGDRVDCSAVHPNPLISCTPAQGGTR